MPTQPLPGQPGFVVPAPPDRPRSDRRAVRVKAVRTDGVVVVEGVITIYVSEKPAR